MAGLKCIIISEMCVNKRHMIELWMTGQLFDFLAVQVRLATAQQLVAAWAVWAMLTERELGSSLVEPTSAHY
jgi:hypothetical protein